MTPKKIESIIKADGWYFTGADGSHRHYKHPKKLGKVTIPFHTKPKDLKRKTLLKILKQAQLDKKFICDT